MQGPELKKNQPTALLSSSALRREPRTPSAPVHPSALHCLQRHIAESRAEALLSKRDGVNWLTSCPKPQNECHAGAHVEPHLARLARLLKLHACYMQPAVAQLFHQHAKNPEIYLCQVALRMETFANPETKDRIETMKRKMIFLST